MKATLQGLIVLIMIGIYAGYANERSHRLGIKLWRFFLFTLAFFALVLVSRYL